MNIYIQHRAFRFFSVLFFAFFSINASAKSDAELYDSSAMNASPNVETASRQEGGVRVVFIGNSITLHAPMPSIGWNNECGMAASSAENDYVHLVMEGIEKKTGRKADVRIRNLAQFERGFKEYDFAKVQDLVDFQPDYLIIALGENVGNLEGEDRIAFRDAFKTLLGCFFADCRRPNAVVRGVFWPNVWKDEMMANAARDYAIPFVRAALSSDKSMCAIGLFKHNGVQNHPGDKGMAEIARRILKGLFPNTDIPCRAFEQSVAPK